MTRRTGPRSTRSAWPTPRSRGGRSRSPRPDGRDTAAAVASTSCAADREPSVRQHRGRARALYLGHLELLVLPGFRSSDRLKTSSLPAFENSISWPAACYRVFRSAAIHPADRLTRPRPRSALRHRALGHTMFAEGPIAVTWFERDRRDHGLWAELGPAQRDRVAAFVDAVGPAGGGAAARRAPSSAQRTSPRPATARSRRSSGAITIGHGRRPPPLRRRTAPRAAPRASSRSRTWRDDRRSSRGLRRRRSCCDFRRTTLARRNLAALLTQPPRSFRKRQPSPRSRAGSPRASPAA